MSRLLALPIALAATLVFAASASAAGCPQQPSDQAFAPFMDPAYYTLAADGGFESADSTWSLENAQVVAGNEPYFINSADDRRSLSISNGGVATSPANCVSIEHPTVRFMVRSTGSLLGVLAVSAVVRDGNGLLETLPVGVVTALGSEWRPSLPMLLTNSLVDALLDGSTPLRLQFRVLGLGGAFQIDDIHIDPYRRG